MLYLFFSISVCFLAVICEGFLVAMSLRGSIVDSKARSGLSSLLNFHVVIGVLQLCCAAVGIAIVVRHDFPCSDKFSLAWDNVLLLSVVVSQLIDIFGILCCFSIFHSHKATGDEYEDVENPVTDSLEDATERWHGRCKTGCKYLQICTCNLFGGNGIGDELETVGVIFARFFHHEGFLDVVPSDVAAGLVLVRLQQRARLLSMRSRSEGASSPLLGSNEGEITDSDSSKAERGAVMMRKKGVYHHIDPKMMGRHIFSGDDPVDLKLLSDAAHYAPYALAAYTHFMYMFMHPACGLCKLCGYRACPNSLPDGSDCIEDNGKKTKIGSRWHNSCCNIGPAIVIGDNCCKLNKTAMLKMVENRNSELVFANFSNDLDIKPYGVFVDKDREAVVISIRGTLSLEDCISDALADAASLEAAGEKWGFDGAGKFAHSGMLRAAMWIRQDLETSGLLSDLLQSVNKAGDEVLFVNENQTDSAVRRPMSTDRGGSLKGPNLYTPLNKKKYRQLVVVGHSLGAGTAAVLSILLRPAYPSLISFAYGAPGSVLDEHTSRSIQSFFTSVILGKDLVGSLSIKNLSTLRCDVLDALVRCKANKNTVMRALFEERAHKLDSLMYSPGTEPESHFKNMVVEFNNHMNRRSEDLRKEKLYVPGRIIHLVKTKTVKSCCSSKKKEYEPTDADLMDFTEIKISPTMVWEHFPDQYCDALDGVVERWSKSS